MQFLPSAAPADVGLCPLRAQRLLDALQSDIDRQRLPGAREHGLFVRPIEHFVRLLDPLVALSRERVLDVVVVGGGAAGFCGLPHARAARMGSRRRSERMRTRMLADGRSCRNHPARGWLA